MLINFQSAWRQIPAKHINTKLTTRHQTQTLPDPTTAPPQPCLHFLLPESSPSALNFNFFCITWMVHSYSQAWWTVAMILEVDTCTNTTECQILKHNYSIYIRGPVPCKGYKATLYLSNTPWRHLGMELKLQACSISQISSILWKDGLVWYSICDLLTLGRISSGSC
jgi:hypothetical protein